MNNAERFVNMVRVLKGDIKQASEAFQGAELGYIERGNDYALIVFHSDDSVSIHYDTIAASLNNDSLKDLIVMSNHGVDDPVAAIWEIIDSTACGVHSV